MVWNILSLFSHTYRLHITDGLVTPCQVNNRSFSSQQLFRCTGEAHTCTHIHTCARVHAFHRRINWEPKVRSEDVVVVNIARCFRGTAPSQKQPALMVSASTCPRGKPPKYHTHTYTHTGDRPISFRSLVCPLRCSSPLLLMIFLILRKETEVRGCVLWSPLFERQVAAAAIACLSVHSNWHLHTHTHTHIHTRAC